MTTNKVSDDLRIFDDQYVEFGGDTSTPGDFQLGYNTGTNKLSLRDAALNIGFTFTDQGATFDMDLTGDFNLAGDLSLGAASSILSAAASVDIVNATPTTVNFAGAAGNINMGKVLSEFVFGSTASRTVALTNVGQGFFVGGSSSGRIHLQGSASAAMIWDDSGGAADNQLVFMNMQAGEFDIKFLTDAGGTRFSPLKWAMDTGAAMFSGSTGAHLFLVESSAELASVAAHGQLFVQDDAPNTLWFINDIGDRIPLGTAAAAFSTLTRTEGTANVWAQTSDEDVWTKVDFNDNNAAVGHEDANLNAVASKANSWITIGADGVGIYDTTLNVGAIGGGVNKDHWFGVAITLATPIDIASVTNTNPPVVTTTSAHGFHNGATTGGNLGVVIAGVTGAGAGAINGSHIALIVNATQFSLHTFAGANPGLPGGVPDASSGDVTVEVHGETMQPRRYSNNTDVGNCTSLGHIDLAVGDTVHGVVGGIGHGDDISGVSIELAVHRH